MGYPIDPTFRPGEPDRSPAPGKLAPSAASDRPARRKPRIVGFILGGLLIAIGIALVPIGALVPTITMTLELGNNGLTFEADSPATVTLERSREYIVYTSYPFSLDLCLVTGPAGQTIAVTKTTTRYQFSGTGLGELTGVQQFRAAEAGQYELFCADRLGVGGFVVALGPSLGSMAQQIGLWLAGAGVVVLVGLALLIVTGVRRGRWTQANRPLRPAGQYGSPGPTPPMAAYPWYGPGPYAGGPYPGPAYPPGSGYPPGSAYPPGGGYQGGAYPGAYPGGAGYQGGAYPPGGGG